MSFGIGAFPFGLFASVFNVTDGRPPARMYHGACSDSLVSHLIIVVVTIIIITIIIIIQHLCRIIVAVFSGS